MVGNKKVPFRGNISKPDLLKKRKGMVQ